MSLSISLSSDEYQWRRAGGPETSGDQRVRAIISIVLVGREDPGVYTSTSLFRLTSDEARYQLTRGLKGLLSRGRPRRESASP